MPIGINFIAAFVGVGGFLLGYDVGIISGVLAMDSFKDVFQYDDWQKGMIVTAFVVGCCFGGTAAEGVDLSASSPPLIPDRLSRSHLNLVLSCRRMMLLLHPRYQTSESRHPTPRNVPMPVPTVLERH